MNLATSSQNVEPSTAGFASSGSSPPAGRGILELPSPFPLAHGGALDRAVLAYEWVGPEDAPGVVIVGGISAGRHVTSTGADPEPGWWQPFVGPGRAVDSRKLRVVGVDFLGGNGRSSGPASGGPRPFPSLDTADQARALVTLLDVLGIDQLEAFIGASYGAMVGLAFAEHFPARLCQLVAISGAERSHPQATAWRSLQRRIVRLGQPAGRAHEALSLARGLAMTTYRSATEFAQRFDAPPRRSADGFRFPVDDYLEARGESFARHFDAEAFLCLSQSIDLHRVDPAGIDVPVTLVAIRSDQLVPPQQMRRLSRRLRGPCRLVELDSLFGHDAFLKEIDAIGALLRSCLSCGGDS